MAKPKKTDENGFPLIGPHVGRELELMLAGQKPMAMFSIQEGMDPKYYGAEFEVYVQNGRFIKLSAQATHPTIERVWYCQPGQEWRARLAKFLYEKLPYEISEGNFIPSDFHRIDGFLLGYSQSSIEHFVELNCKD
jgi:hypothetical protein